MVLNRELKKVGFIVLVFMISNLNGQTNYFNSFDGIKIAYNDEGDGQAILLIHGFINSKNSWNKTELKKSLISKGYRVITPDLRGNGDSEKPHTDEAYANNAEVKDLLLLIDYLKLDNYMALGYSRGSIILAELLTQESRITKAVLGGMGIDFTNPNWNRRLLFADAFNGKITEASKDAVAYAKSIKADLQALHLQQKHQPSTSKKELLNIKIPILVIAGDEDFDNGNPKYLKEAIPNAKLAIVKGDHNNTYKTESFSKAVLKFFSE